jgi:AcrR family transcriptional regulator
MRIAYHPAMSAAPATAATRAERRARTRAATRAAILEAARRVAAREGARDLSLRAVAAEAGFAPAALYGYFRGKDALLLALAADDLAAMAHAMRTAAKDAPAESRLAAAAEQALSFLSASDTLAAVQSALPAIGGDPEAERHFNGRLIAALTALSTATGKPAASRGAQADVVLMAASLVGLALLVRSGRLAALGFSSAEILARLVARYP